MYFYGQLDGLNAAPWRALVIAGVLFVYCALVRLMLERMHARLFDISSAAAIILWISFLPYEVFMQAWEKTVVAPIRVDLLLVAVVLNIATGICVASSMWALFQKLRTMWVSATLICCLRGKAGIGVMLAPVRCIPFRVVPYALRRDRRHFMEQMDSMQRWHKREK